METGNSTSTGCLGGPGEVIHATAPAISRDLGFMFRIGNMKPASGSSGARGLATAVVRPAELADFAPIHEQVIEGKQVGETHGTALLAWLAWRRAALGEAPELTFYRTHGAAGNNIGQISKGTQPYANGLTELRRAGEIAKGYGKTILCEDCFLSNGHQDRTQGLPGAAFKAALHRLAGDQNADWPAITGQSRPVRIWLNQLCGNLAPARSRGSDIQLAQNEFVRENPLARMVGPRYPFWLGDITHFVAERGYLWEGEYMAKAVHQELSGRPWKALGQDVTTERDGETIVVTFDRGGLTFDTRLVLPPMPPTPATPFTTYEAGGGLLDQRVVKGHHQPA